MPLAQLKELCDKHKLYYKLSKPDEVKVGSTQTNYRVTIKVVDVITSEIKIKETGDPGTSKNIAKHNAAAKAIMKLGELERDRASFQIEEPESLSSKIGSPKTKVSKKMGDQLPATTSELDGFEHIRELGNGGFGVVHLMIGKTDNQYYAAKIIKLPPLDTEKFMREARVLAWIEHDHIVRYKYSTIKKAPDDWKKQDLWKTLQEVESLYSEASSSLACAASSETTADDPPTCLCIVTEYCKKGTLDNWLKRPDERLKNSIIEIFNQILLALCYLHGGNREEKVYIHRDLKPSNIFLTEDEPDKIHIKVGDFGLVKDQSLDTLSGTSSGIPSQSASQGGTFLYMSPEQRAHRKYTEKVDMYALGLILFELLYPMETESEKIMMFDQLKKRKFPNQFKEQRPDRAVHIINRLVCNEPKERWSAKELSESDVYRLFKKKMRQGQRKILPRIQ